MTTTNIEQQIQAFNYDVAGWGKRVSNRAIANVRRLKQHESTPQSKLIKTHKNKSLAQSINQKTFKRDGEIDRVGFSFAQHGVFFQKGVGRGHVMQNGIVVRGHKKKIGRNLHDKRTTFIAAAGPIRRKPADWFNGMINKETEKLANIVIEHYADRVVNATQLTIR